MVELGSSAPARPSRAGLPNGTVPRHVLVFPHDVGAGLFEHRRMSGGHPRRFLARRADWEWWERWDGWGWRTHGDRHRRVGEQHRRVGEQHRRVGEQHRRVGGCHRRRGHRSIRQPARARDVRPVRQAALPEDDSPRAVVLEHGSEPEQRRLQQLPQRLQWRQSVIFDALGPGAIYRFWHTEETVASSQAQYKFYFDGETTARLTINLKDMWGAGVSPFASHRSRPTRTFRAAAW